MTAEQSAVDSQARPAPDSRVGTCVPAIAYLLSQYPAVSHTFLLHEVLGLRARGLHLETASINRPDRSRSDLPAAEAAEADATHYVKTGRWFGLLLRLFTIMVNYPFVTMRGLLAVLAVPALTLRKRLLWMFYLAEALLVGRWMRERRLNHLHVHFGGPVASVGMLTAHAWRVPFSLTIHGPEELLNHEACHLREKLEAATFVLCISDFCRSQLCQLLPPAAWPKLHVCRLGVDPTLLTPTQRCVTQPDPSEPILHLVCTGRLVPAKGHHVLLEALLLLARRGITLETTLIGNGPERASLEAFAVHHDLASHIRFTGALSHPETLARVRRADIFVLASFAEGIPVAFMEAMALAIPCVGTFIAGIPELIRDGREGLLVAPSNAEELANALALLVRDQALRRRLGSSGRERIVSSYNLPLNHERLADLFSKLAGPGKPSSGATR